MRNQVVFVLSLSLLLVACTAPLQLSNTPTSEAVNEPVVISITEQVTPSPAPIIITPTLFIPTATPTPEIDLVWHTVKSGESLVQIAEYYKVNLADLATVNYLDNIDLIYADQILLIAKSEPDPASYLTTGKQIVVVRHEQKVFAYEEGKLIKEFIVSTGTPGYETVLGEYHTYSKLESEHMYGDGYDHPAVPWTMYFFRGYALHGADWHNNFGTPMSRGCVNMKVDEAEWLFNWAPINTPVIVLP